MVSTFTTIVLSIALETTTPRRSWRRPRSDSDWGMRVIGLRSAGLSRGVFGRCLRRGRLGLRFGLGDRLGRRLFCGGLLRGSFLDNWLFGDRLGLGPRLLGRRLGDGLLYWRLRDRFLGGRVGDGGRAGLFHRGLGTSLLDRRFLGLLLGGSLLGRRLLLGGRLLRGVFLRRRLALRLLLGRRGLFHERLGSRLVFLLPGCLLLVSHSGPPLPRARRAR